MIYKPAAATITYTMDWSEWLPDGDTISASVWAVDGVTNESDSNTTTTTTIKISGGVTGDVHTITNTITTAAGSITPRTLYVKIQDQGS